MTQITICIRIIVHNTSTKSTIGKISLSRPNQKLRYTMFLYNPYRHTGERPVGLFHCWPSLSLFYAKHTSQSPTKVLLMNLPQGWCLRCIEMSEAQCLIHLKHFLSTTNCSKTCCASGVQGNFPQTYSDRWRVYNDRESAKLSSYEAPWGLERDLGRLSAKFPQLRRSPRAGDRARECPCEATPATKLPE